MYPKNFLTNIMPTGPFSAAKNGSKIYPKFMHNINIHKRDYSNLKPLVIWINAYSRIYQTETLII